MKVKEIKRALERLAPPELKEEWDNVGLMVGNLEQDIDKILVLKHTYFESIIINLVNPLQTVLKGHKALNTKQVLLLFPNTALIQ